MVCDQPQKLDALKQSYNGSMSITYQLIILWEHELGVPGITVLPDGHRTSGFIMYAVETEFIGPVVAQYGSCSLYISRLSILPRLKFRQSSQKGWSLSRNTSRNV